MCIYDITEEFGSTEVYSGLNLIPSPLELCELYGMTTHPLSLSVCLSVFLSLCLSVSLSVSVSVSPTLSLCSLQIAGLQGFVVEPPSAECGGAVDRT